MQILSKKELKRNGRKFCCRLFPEQCNRDDFRTPRAEHMHFERTHGNGALSASRPNLPPASSSSPSIGKPANVLEAVVKVLREHPEGYGIKELVAKVRETGIETTASDTSMGTYIAAQVRTNPDAGIVKGEQKGFYKYGGSQTPNLPVPADQADQAEKPRRIYKRKGKNQEVAVPATPRTEVIDPRVEELVLLRHGNRIKNDAILKIMEAVYLLVQ